MPKVGDRVIIAGTKVGERSREGTLIGIVGPLINVRWSDGTVSLFKPGAGSVAYETGNGASAAGKGRAPKKTAGKKAPASAPAAKAAATKAGKGGTAKAAKKATGTKKGKPAAPKARKSAKKR